MKKIAVTGANGFVGSTFCRILADKGWQVVPLVRPAADISLLPDSLQPERIDYNDTDRLTALLQDCEILIHNAGLTRSLHAEQMLQVNASLTRQLVKIFNSVDKLQQFIYISSQAACGPSDGKMPFTEDSLCHPLSTYGKSKLLAENIVKDNTAKPWTILRPAAVFGPGDKDFLLYFKLLKFHLAPYLGSIHKKFSIIYVDDLANLLCLLLLNPSAYEQTFFGAYEEAVLMSDFVEILERVMNTFSNSLVIPVFLLQAAAFAAEWIGRVRSRTPLLSREKLLDLQQPFWVVSNRKAREILGFQPEFDVYEGAVHTYRWYREKGWL